MNFYEKLTRDFFNHIDNIKKNFMLVHERESIKNTLTIPLIYKDSFGTKTKTANKSMGYDTPQCNPFFFINGVSGRGLTNRKFSLFYSLP